MDSIDRYDGLAQFFKRRSRDIVFSCYSPTAIIGVAELATCLAVASWWRPWLKAWQVLPAHFHLHTGSKPPLIACRHTDNAQMDRWAVE